MYGLIGCVGTSPNGGSASAARSSDEARQYPLNTLPTAEILANGEPIRVWIAQEFDSARPNVTAEGLMYVRPEEIADDQGMLFVFADERVRGFWMLNTVTPLDVAYARYDGTIVKTWQMPPGTLNSFSSVEPAMFALEMKQGAFARLGIVPGARLVIPDRLLQPLP